MKEKLKIIPDDLLKRYLLKVNKGLKTSFDKLKDAEISPTSFSFYTSVSSVFSSKIEGEEIELDSYIKHKKFGIEFLPDYTKKIDDLYNQHQLVNFGRIVFLLIPGHLKGMYPLEEDGVLLQLQ